MDNSRYKHHFNTLCARPVRVQAMLNEWATTDAWWTQATPATFKQIVRSAEGVVRLTAAATAGSDTAFEVLWLVAAQHHHIRTQIGGQVELDDLIQELVLSFLERPTRPKATVMVVMKNSTQNLRRRQTAHATRRHGVDTLDTAASIDDTGMIDLRASLETEFGSSVVCRLELMAGGQSGRSVGLNTRQWAPVKAYVRDMQAAA